MVVAEARDGLDGTRLLGRVLGGCAVGCLPQLVLFFLAISVGPWWIFPGALFLVPVFAVLGVHLYLSDGAPIQPRRAALDLSVVLGLLLLLVYLMGGPVVTRYSGFVERPIPVGRGVELRIEAMSDWETEGRASRQVGPFHIRVHTSGAEGAALSDVSLEPLGGNPIPLSADRDQFNERSILVFDAVPLEEVEHRFRAKYVSPLGMETEVDAVLEWRVRKTMSLARFEYLMGV